MKSSKWAVIDTETTGIDNAAIVEVAVALFRSGELLEPPKSWLVNPGFPIPPEATAVHGITDAMVAWAPPIGQVIPALCSVVADADMLVGYNALHFDLPLLARWGGDLWAMAVAGKPVVDPLVLVRHDSIGRYWRGPGRHRLGNVCERYGITAEGAHRAAADCVMTGRLLWALGPQAGAFPSDARELAKALGPLAVQQEADYQAWKARQA